jgi:hypothetical protein
MIRLEFCVFGRKVAEMKCHFWHIITRVLGVTGEAITVGVSHGCLAEVVIFRCRTMKTSLHFSHTALFGELPCEMYISGMRSFTMEVEYLKFFCLEICLFTYTITFFLGNVFIHGIMI